VLTGLKAKLLLRVWQHYLLQQQVMSNVIGSTGKIRCASESEIAVEATGVYHTESGSCGSGFYSTVSIRDLVEGQQEQPGNMRLLSTQPSKSHYRLDEDRRLVRVLLSLSFTVLRQISNTPWTIPQSFSPPFMTSTMSNALSKILCIPK
jgi:hypothetical protein